MQLFRGVTVVACAALLLGAAACAPEEQEAGANVPIRLYGTDGNMSNSFGESFAEHPGVLAGMKGTTALTPLSEDFIARIRGVDGRLDDFTYAGETYDAVVISALAAQLAGTTEPTEIARHINGVTAQGDPCETVNACLEMARDGRNLQYRGVSLRRGGFTDAGEPSTATYATLHFDTNHRLDRQKTEYVGVGDESATSAEKPPSARAVDPLADTGAPLVFGGLLPATGDLALMNPPMLAGARLAVQEINDAGGVFGQDVQWIDGDDGTDPKVAKATVTRHIAAGVHVIIGAGASGVTRAVLPDVVAARRILFSPSNTAADLTNAEDDGLYFRTAPSDVMQGRALTDVMLRDGVQRIVIVARRDTYGEGLQALVREELERVGVSAANIRLLGYEPPESGETPAGMDAIAESVRAHQADAVLVIGFGESAAVIKALADANVPIYR